MKKIISASSVDVTVQQLRVGIAAENMRVVAHINGQENAAKIGESVPPDQILEVFRPDYAVRVWHACKAAGYDIPLRIHVYQEQAKSVVACRMPSETFAAYGSHELDAIGVELDTIFTSILQHVGGSDE